MLSFRLQHSLDAVLLIALSLGAFYVGARTALLPRETGGGVAVVFAPWTSPAHAMSRAAAAGGRFVRFGGMPFIAVVMPDDDAYPSRMLGEGAWLVADPRAVAACLSVFRPGTTS